MHDTNELECLIFDIAIKNIVLEKVTKGEDSDANNKLLINIIPTVGSHRPQPLVNKVNTDVLLTHYICKQNRKFPMGTRKGNLSLGEIVNVICI